MVELISVTQLLLCAAVLALAVWVLRSGRPSLLAFTLAGFVVIDSVGVAIAPYLPLSDIQYLNGPAFLINERNPDLYLRQVMAHWVLLTVGTAGLLLEAQYRRSQTMWVAPSSRQLVMWAGLLIVVGLVAYARYFLMGPGLEILLGSRLSFSSTMEAVAHRTEVRYSVETGQGAYLAALAGKVLFPVAAALLAVGRVRFRGWIWLMCFVLSAAYAFHTREKSPLLAVFITYAALLLWERVGRLDWRRINFRAMARILLPTLLLFFLGGTAFYTVNFGLPFDVAMQSIVARTLAIPGATETNFFAVFPEKYDFRGIENIFRIGLLGYGGQDVSIYEVAVAATGDGFATNASLLAVSWSGAGYLGVTIIALLLVGSLALIDRVLVRLDYRVFLLSAILSVSAFIGLTSGSILDYIGWGGLVSPALLLFLLTWRGLGRRTASPHLHKGNYGAP
ncbi:hypothetical protein HNR42_001274 [Deinobacterium chartae]|uniref:Oligosaccharide repeat unit polymerase n=1 Tax=Deinobacterium chartae TaxID=521158 RepID=A0A841HWE6_9DEIO|nr:hypothetical protein [Deinobacterium chartae]MBB6097851.1 hypothetical protein [Deinobacterium chartae]